jgi:acyl-CoA thioester hydrolase
MRYSCRFPVRVYELDSLGELHSAGFLRFLQQAATDASAAVGYGPDWYTTHETTWLVRRTDLELIEPAREGDEIVVETWVSDIRRVRSLREYDLRRASDNTRIARAHTDWVYIDLRSGQPIQPPGKMQHDLMPGGIERRARRPRRPMAPDDPLVTRVEVRLADLDQLGHVNNSNYASYVEQALFDALTNRGWPVDPRSGCLPRPSHHDIEYLNAAVYRDPIEARVWVSALGERTFSSHCVLQRGATALVRAASQWRWRRPPPDAARKALAALERDIGKGEAAAG